jgi:5-methylcytosine-specific restriction endonuclease McrA
VWEQFVDYLVPLLRLKPAEQAIYFYLLRQTRMKGDRIATLSRKAIAAGAQRSVYGLNAQLMRLVRKGCLRVEARVPRGVTVEVLLPREIMAWLKRGGHRKVDLIAEWPAHQNPAKRLAILRREKGRCFYCRKRLESLRMWLDHLEPLSVGGSTRMENLVACCKSCNLEKGASRASRYLYLLYRTRRLSRGQYKDRMKALRRMQLALAEAMEG